MNLSIKDLRLLQEAKSFAPGRTKKLAEHILNLNRSLYVLSNKRAKDYVKIRVISESEQILTSIFSDFLAFFQIVSNLLKKDSDKESPKKLLNDLTNLRKEITMKTHELIARPSEKIYEKYWHDADNLISQPIFSLILPSIITSWEESKTEINCNLIECNETLFYETFHREVLSLIGQFPAFQIFKSPKTIASPILSSGDKREISLELYEQMKNEKKSKEELIKEVPEELIQKEENVGDKSESLSEPLFDEEIEEGEEVED